MQIKKNKVKADRDSLQVLTRLCAYVIRNYRVSCFFVLIFIIISSLATVASSLFLKSLIDDYIAPILASNGPADFGPLFRRCVPWLPFMYAVLLPRICMPEF